MQESNVRILYVGAVKEAIAAIRNQFPEREELSCETRAELEKLLKTGQAQAIHVVLAGPEFTNMTHAELAQTMMMMFRNIPIIFASNASDTFAQQQSIKSAFPSSHILPTDRAGLDASVKKAALEIEHRKFSKVRLVDIEPGTKLDFQLSLFLPANNKYIALNNIGDELEGDRLKRLIQFKQTSVFVPVFQVTSFHIYSAKRLLELGADPSSRTSMTAEKQARLLESVRELLHGLVTDQYAKYLKGGRSENHTRHIIQQFIKLIQPPDWYLRVMDAIQPKGDTYSHGGNAGLFAALFAMALGQARAHEMAAAGAIHDLGMSLLPTKLQHLRPEKMTAPELALYKKHPQMAIEELQKKKLNLTEPVIRAVLQHHERWTGTGFPDGAVGKRISSEAQMLALADRFDYLTQTATGDSPLSPDQAIRQIEKEGISNPDMIRELRLIFERDQKATA